MHARSQRSADGPINTASSPPTYTFLVAYNFAKRLKSLRGLTA